MGRGRPDIYWPLIKNLEDGELYSMDEIIQLGEKNGFFKNKIFYDMSISEAKFRARRSLTTRIWRKKINPDDQIEISGRVVNGYYGWRLKNGILDRNIFTFKEWQKRKGSLNDGGKRTIFGFTIQHLRGAWPWIGASSNRNFKFLSIFCFCSLLLFSWHYFHSSSTFSVFDSLNKKWMDGIYAEGIRTFREDGARAGLEYFDSLEKGNPQDPITTFHKAWAQFSLGEFKESERACYNLLQNKDIQQVTIGNCYFLLGNIETRTGRFKSAIEHYFTALKIFKNIGKNNNIYRTYCSLSNLAIQQWRFAEADCFLSEAEEVCKSSDLNPGELFQLRAELAFWRGNYKTAIEFSYQQYDLYRKANKITNEIDALIGLGFYMILNGDLEEGLRKTMEAQVMINECGGEDKMYFTLINLLLIRRCEGKDFGALVAPLETHIQRKNDKRLMNLLEFAISYDCNLSLPQGAVETENVPSK